MTYVCLRIQMYVLLYYVCNFLMVHHLLLYVGLFHYMDISGDLHN